MIRRSPFNLHGADDNVCLLRPPYNDVLEDTFSYQQKDADRLCLITLLAVLLSVKPFTLNHLSSQRSSLSLLFNKVLSCDVFLWSSWEEVYSRTDNWRCKKSLSTRVLSSLTPFLRHLTIPKCHIFASIVCYTSRMALIHPVSTGKNYRQRNPWCLLSDNFVTSPHFVS